MSLDRLPRILRAPKFGDEESDSIARSMNVISGATAVLGMVLFASAPGMTPEPAPSMVVYASITIFSLASLFLLRRRRLKQATTLFSITTFLVTTAALVMFGGISGPVAASYVLAVLIISSISGWRAGMAATIACIIASGVMAYYEHRGLFPAPVSPLTPLTAWATVASLVSLGALALFLSSRAIHNALHRARENERMLEEHRDNLEVMVEERSERFVALFNQAKVAILDCDLTRLSKALSEMSTAELEESETDRLAELFAKIEIVTLNRQALACFGARSEKVLEKGLAKLVTEASRPMLLRLFEGLSEGWDSLEEEGVLQTLAGDELRVIVGLSMASADDMQTIITISDVTPLQHAQRAAEEVAELRASELERVNEEVERLFYAVSHDLRSPLRAVANLADWAREDMEEGNRDEVNAHLDKIKIRVERLERMMNDVLSFARIGRTLHYVERVDVDKLLTDIRDGLVSLPKDFTMEWSEMPVLMTEKTLLSQVFLNLVGNAVKHHDTESGRIVVSHRDTEDGAEFTVSDDGPGIPEQHREKVFDMFATLKPRDKVEGSGMGLAFVHKIVTRRGGRLVVEESDIGGAAFRFTWGKARSPNSLVPGRPSTPPASVRVVTK